MFKDKDARLFFLYILIFILFIVAGGVVIKWCLIPGSSCEIPFLSRNNDYYTFIEAPEMELKDGVDYKVKIVTNLGEFTIDLYEKNAPLTVNNFVFLVNRGYYKNVKFHRILKNFLLQTGDRNTLDDNPNNDGNGNPGYFIQDEMNWDAIDLNEKQREELESLGFESYPGVSSKELEQYSVAMSNPKKPNKNGSQFFIIITDSNDTQLSPMQGLYTVFGEVEDGFDTLRDINKIPVDENNSPRGDVVIESIKILEL